MSLTPQERQRVVELFDQIHELPEDKLPAALDAACEGSVELRAEVMLLLEADRAAMGAFLKRPALEDAAELLARRAGSRPGAGTIIGNYQIIRQIGAGGMGVVYEAIDRRLQRRAALKILPQPPAGEGTERIKRFQQEARAASLLSHPNIVPIYDADFDQGYYFIAMELVEGRTLRSIMAEERTIDNKKILDWIAQAALALGVAHEAGIVHRDIKPENIMVRSDGFVKVLDFGLAKLRDPSSGSAGHSSEFLTRPGHVAGTIHYLSPEQVSGRPVDGRSDLFSLGVVAYELVTGVRPFVGPTDGTVFDAILHQEPARPSSIRPTIDSEIDSLILSALEKDPDLRFQTAADMRSRSRRLIRDSAPSRSVISSVPAVSAFHWSKIALWGGATAIACAVTAAVLWFATPKFLRVTHNPPTPFRFERLTDLPGEESSPSISADGKQFVYSSAAEGKSHIYLQRTGGNTPINLTKDSTEDDREPALSPDGQHIAFRSERDGGGLFVMESTGENPKRISRRGYLPAWSPDGRYVIYSDQDFSTPSARNMPVGRLYVVDAGDGSERKLENTDDAIQPHWSPHGDRIAYWGIAAGGRRDIYTTAASGQGRPVAVTEDAFLDWYPVWSPSGTYLYFLSDRGGLMNIWRVAIEETSGRTLGPPEPVTVPAQYVAGLSIAADGKTLLYSQTSPRNTLASVDFDPVRHTAVGDRKPVAGGSHFVSNFGFSPDGSKLVFDTLGDSTENLWIMNSDGSGRRRLTSGPSRDRAPDWSPAGDQIVFLSDRSGQYNEWLIRADGSGLRPVTAVDHPSMQKPVWVPDGKRILATRARAGPALLDASPATPITDPGVAPGLQGAEDLFFTNTTADGGGLAIGNRTRAGGGPVPAVYGLASARLELFDVKALRSVWLRGGTDPRHRYFLSVLDSDCFLYDRLAKRNIPVFSIRPNRFYYLAMHPDGRRIYYSQTIRDGDLWLANLEK